MFSLHFETVRKVEGYFVLTEEKMAQGEIAGAKNKAKIL